MRRWRSAYLVALLLSASPAVADPLAWESALRSPLYVTHHALALDPAGRRAVAFGGVVDGVLSDRIALLDLDSSPARWTQLLGPGGPSARWDARAFYDAPRGRFLVFGGEDTIERQDLWAFDPSSEAWTELTPGPPPPPGIDPSDPVVYDSRRGRLVIVLSQDAAPCELWALDLTAPGAAWALVAMTGAPLLGPSSGAAYDSTGDRVLVLGGIDTWGSGYQSQTLRQADLTTGTWSPLHPRTCLTTLHVPRLAVDEATRRLIVHQSNGDPSSSCQVSSFDLGATVTGQSWLVEDEPPYVDGQAVAFDALTGRLLLHGGEPSILLHTLATREAFEWSSLVFDDGLPRATEGMAGAADPLGRGWYVHGGYSRTNLRVCTGLPPGAHCLSSDLYRIDLDDPRRIERLFPAGGGPGVLYDHVAVFDSIGRRILFQGGYDSVGTIRNEVWALELEGPLRWTPVATTAPGVVFPGPALQGHAATIDPGRRILYALGGTDQTLWALDLNVEPAAWSVMRTGFLGFSDAIAGFDPATRRLLIHNWNQSRTEFEVDVSTPAATVTTLVGDGSHGVSQGVGAWDSRRRRLLAVNGYLDCFCNFGGWPYWGVWSLRDHGTLEYGEIGVVNGAFVPRRNSIAAYDPVRDRMLLHTGIDNDLAASPPEKHGVWTLQFDVSTPTRLDLVDAVANESGASIRVRFSGEGADGEVRVDRATGAAGDEWVDVGAALESTPGLYEFTDTDVARGATYRYRGRWFADGVEHATAASAPVTLAGVAIPALQLRARAGIVTRAWPIEFEVQLVPSAGKATLEVIDVAGRVQARRSITASGTVALKPDSGGAGIYFARLRQGDAAVSLRIVRL